jgi:hypothetical protein
MLLSFQVKALMWKDLMKKRAQLRFTVLELLLPVLIGVSPPPTHPFIEPESWLKPVRGQLLFLKLYGTAGVTTYDAVTTLPSSTVGPAVPPDMGVRLDPAIHPWRVDT